MSDVSDALTLALSRRANDQRRQATQYTNLEARPGSSRVPRRLLSDIGFLTSASFGYINAHPAHVIPPEDAAPRPITQIALSPYGLSFDAACFSGANRNVRHSRGAGNSGAAVMAQDGRLVVSAELDADTYSEQKNYAVRYNMTTARRGPAFHALIDRRGGVAVGPGIDYQTLVARDRAPVAVFVGLEGALAQAREDFDAGRADYFELPYTSVQVTSLAILLAKLYTAFPDIPRSVVSDAEAGAPATIYLLPEDIPAARQLNFSDGRWAEQRTYFSYGATDNDQLSAAVLGEGAFDLPTEVFRTAEAPPAVAARDVARVTLGRVDTMGALSIALGAYTSLAVPERSASMQGQGRRELFVTRERASHLQADQTGERAGATAAGIKAVTVVVPEVRNDEPHVYDYTNGHWGDGGVV